MTRFILLSQTSGAILAPIPCRSKAAHRGPVATKARRDFRAFVAQRAAKAKRNRDIEASLFEPSKKAIAQSFAVLAKVPEGMERGPRFEMSDGVPGYRDRVSDRPAPWQALLADGAGDRFVFGIDGGERMRRDDVGLVVSHEEAIPREAKAVLSDLADAEIPGGRTRIHTAKVRDPQGVVVYRGPMTMKPLPND